MTVTTTRAALAAALFAFAMPAAAQQAPPQAAEAPARCGGLFCDLYYASNPPRQPGAPEPAPGTPGTTRLACHDFVCGMFGGRTPDAPVATAAVEPPPGPAEPAVKPKKKRAPKHGAERTAKNEAKPAKAVEPAAQ